MAVDVLVNAFHLVLVRVGVFGPCLELSVYDPGEAFKDGLVSLELVGEEIMFGECVFGVFDFLGKGVLIRVKHVSERVVEVLEIPVDVVRPFVPHEFYGSEVSPSFTLFCAFAGLGKDETLLDQVVVEARILLLRVRKSLYDINAIVDAFGDAVVEVGLKEHVGEPAK